MMHYEGTIDGEQPVPPSPGMDHDPSTILESSVVLLAGAAEVPVEALMCQGSLVGLAKPERTSQSRRGSAPLLHRD